MTYTNNYTTRKVNKKCIGCGYLGKQICNHCSSANAEPTVAQACQTVGPVNRKVGNTGVKFACNGKDAFVFSGPASAFRPITKVVEA